MGLIRIATIKLKPGTYNIIPCQLIPYRFNPNCNYKVKTGNL